MTVLDRSELEASPLSDLHLIASQAGVEGFRRLRKADLIDAILVHQGGEGAERADEPERETDAEERPARSRRSRGGRSRRSGASAERESEGAGEERRESGRGERGRGSGRGEGERESGRAAKEERESGRAAKEERESGRAAREGRESERSPEQEHKTRGASTARSDRDAEERAQRADERTAEGTVELLGNGSGFLRVHPPESSEEDVYISAAQVRRCELVSGDKVTGPVRTPRRSERYASLVRVETINGQPADSVAEGTRYEELPVSWPSERIAFDAQDATLQAIEWLTPFGRGSRVLIVGGARAGKSETLRRMLAALAARGEQAELLAVLAGVRPEEIGEWQEGPVAPRSALSFAASADAQGQAVENVVESAKRLAARGAHAIVAVDGLDSLHPHTARRVLAAARNLREGGSLTVIATASRPFGGETTVIALAADGAAAGRFPALDLEGSGTLKVELLVGEEGAAAIAKAHADALDG